MTAGFSISARSSSPSSATGRAVGLRGVLTDVTERKDAELALERNLLRLKKTVRSAVRAVADVVEALKKIEAAKGRLYDRAAAEACLRLFREGRFAWPETTSP